ncbi:transcriptional attenuator, LytR family [Streptomyces sp. DvalAA-14]|uniref:LCP family protein n=1 Tax=unclassified Streptomyces TaxID=2593676 RepID=UPI00081B1570|nr:MULTISPECIES: LCP family protein [unclassified Streptomyces]MYS19483.1 LytR family transcriptional regulator [Streptomyces sp. SID4948]SCD45604.1 transcriptional attenuator, LytR family [Streptomyces sp. DvalAA-14]
MSRSRSNQQNRGSSRHRASSTEPQGPVVGGRAAARKQQKRGGKRALKITAWTTGIVVLLGVGTATYAYSKLSGNIKSADLYAGKSGDAGHEKADAFGRTPINILMIGSDGRTSAADCKLGGACATASGARADVEMVVHISADRSNATVMSIPRDLRADLPACVDNDNHTSVGEQPDTMINSALNWGPGCSVAAVHQLTGIPIDHFMMVDFSGVVNMSDAVGGVSVCVDNNVYDPYSHLKLKKGTHVLQGVAALEFLRTRHGFGTGSDTGRTVSQHMFLTSMVNKFKSQNTLSSPTKLWSLANAATKSLTVDKSIKPVQKLIGLANDVNKVPTDRMTFTTMQTQDEPLSDGTGTKTVMAPQAASLFKTIANDQSLSTAKPAKGAPGAKPKPSGPPPVPPAQIAVVVRNGTGIGGRAGEIAKALIGDGFSKDTTSGNGDATPTSTLTYPAGEQAQAKSVASALGLPAAALVQGTGTQLVLLIGADWTTGDAFPGGKVKAAPADTAAALSGANQQKGNENGKCAPVSTFSTIGETADGRVTTKPSRYGMTPIKAYAISGNVKDSAP